MGLEIIARPQKSIAASVGSMDIILLKGAMKEMPPKAKTETGMVNNTAARLIQKAVTMPDTSLLRLFSLILILPANSLVFPAASKIPNVAKKESRKDKSAAV